MLCFLKVENVSKVSKVSIKRGSTTDIGNEFLLAKPRYFALFYHDV